MKFEAIVPAQTCSQQLNHLGVMKNTPESRQLRTKSSLGYCSIDLSSFALMRLVGFFLSSDPDGLLILF